MSEDEREDEQRQFTELRRGKSSSLRDQLIEEHMWLARHCARRFSGKGESPDDLLQVANMALVKAVDRFDPSFKVRFATFAVPTITGELRRHFRDRTWSMRVSRRLKDLHLELKSVSEQMAHDLGRAPSVDELAAALDVTPEQVLEALEAGAAYRASSLDAPVGGEGEEGIIPGETHGELEDTGVRVMLQEAMSNLPERERRVVYLRFYLGLTQSEIAEEIGVSQVHVSRILRATLAQLADELGTDVADTAFDAG
ncbi:MAG: SigB/SigF/SigG family RNA polymerase sigma factor [Acidimicrobiales bacterium]